jgi:hypothetical protein
VNLFALVGLLSATGVFLGMLLFSEVGRRMGIARLNRDPEGLTKGTGAAESGVFGLLALLIAFTFSGAASRFEDRRHLITDEANAIGTAYLRVDLLPGDEQPAIRELFRQYTQARSTAYRNAADQLAIGGGEGAARWTAMQGEIWTKAWAACRRAEAPPQATMLLLPALNEMIDITTTRATASQNHPPPVVFGLLGGLCLVSALLVGYGISPSKGRSWFHPLMFAAILSLTVYVIIDLEFPRLGLIRVDAADQVLIDLQRSMH